MRDLWNAHKRPVPAYEWSDLDNAVAEICRHLHVMPLIIRVSDTSTSETEPKVTDQPIMSLHEEISADAHVAYCSSGKSAIVKIWQTNCENPF